MTPEVKRPRPFSLSGPHCSVSFRHPVTPSEGNGPALAPFALPFTGSPWKLNVTASGDEPSGSMRIAPVPSALGPAYTCPLKSNTYANVVAAPSGAAASCTASATVTVAPAEPLRTVTPSSASVPDTVAVNAEAPSAVPRQDQVKETDAPPATFCVDGVGPWGQFTIAVSEIDIDAVNPFTPTPPVSVTVSVAVNESDRSTAVGTVRVADNEEGACSEIAVEVTGDAASATPEFASVPEAPAESRSESGGVPAAVNFQRTTTVLPPGTSTMDCAAGALRLPEPEDDVTVGGSGVALTFVASASPVFVTPS